MKKTNNVDCKKQILQLRADKTELFTDEIRLTGTYSRINLCPANTETDAEKLLIEEIEKFDKTTNLDLMRFEERSESQKNVLLNKAKNEFRNIKDYISAIDWI